MASETYSDTVKLGDKERFDKEQIGVKKQFLLTNLPIYFIRIRNNFRVTKKFLITKFDCIFIKLEDYCDLPQTWTP